MKKVLILGGSSYIGRHLIAKINPNNVLFTYCSTSLKNFKFLACKTAFKIFCCCFSLKIFAPNSSFVKKQEKLCAAMLLLILKLSSASRYIALINYKTSLTLSYFSIIMFCSKTFALKV